MQRSVEGLVLNKFPYGDRHLICHLLLRSGNKVSILFMGGRGGGKKLKPGILELGYLVKVELRRTRSAGALPVAGEWCSQWVHQNIRRSYKAFHLMCFFLELVGKIATEEDIHSSVAESYGNEKTFGVLANGLFYLEQRISCEGLDFSFEASVFISKLLMALGVFPSLKECIFCGEWLCSERIAAFVVEQGGFACIECWTRPHVGEDELWKFLTRLGGASYKELSVMGKREIFQSGLLLIYFCYQFHLDAGMVKTGNILN